MQHINDTKDLVDYDGKALILMIRRKGPQFWDQLNRVKSIKGRTWNFKTNYWMIPPTIENYGTVTTWGFNPSPAALEYFDPSKILPPSQKPKAPIALEGLRPYQQDGVAFLSRRSGNAILGDEMGLGKSVQVASWLKANPEMRPAIIVCPASLKINWQREIKKWAGENAEILSGMAPMRLNRKGVYIINYDILGYEDPQDKKREALEKEKFKKALDAGKIPPNSKYRPGVIRVIGWVDSISEISPAVVIMDEAQYIASPSPIRTRAILKIKGANPKCAMLPVTGTLSKNRPSELFTALNLVSPSTFPNRFAFLKRYCDPKHNGFGWEYKGLTNGDELYKKMTTIMIRRLKGDVLKDLPAKQRQIIHMELDPADLRNYKQASEEFRLWLASHLENGIEAENQMEKLRQLAYIAKRNACIAWIEDVLESGNKLIVGTFHQKAIADLLWKFGDRGVYIDGSTPLKARQVSVDRFQNDPECLLFVGQIQSAGVGLTLTAASTVAFVELPWSPADCEQMEDRAHRFGQKDSVNAYYLLAPDTIETDVTEMIDLKYRMQKKVSDGVDVPGFFEREVAEYGDELNTATLPSGDDVKKMLLNKYRGKK